MAGLPAQISADITRHLDAIGRHFKQPKITLIVRAPQLDDGDLVMTNDGLAEARAALLRFEEKGH